MTRESQLYRFYQPRVNRQGEYHGWVAAEVFTSVEEEYIAARRLGLIDSTCWGRLRLSGRDCLDLLHRLSTNDLLDLAQGESRGTILTTDKGRIVDFVTVFRGTDGLLLIVSPTKAEAVVSWIGKFIIMEDVAVEDISGNTVMVTFLGTEADPFLSALLQIHSSNPPVVSLPWGDMHLIPGVLPGTPEMHVVVRSASAERFWGWLEKSCLADGAVPMIGLSAFEANRITQGVPMAETELQERHTPYDVGLRDFINYTKGCYVGQEVIARLDTYQKANREMAGLVFEQGSRSVSPMEPLVLGETEVGWVTSSTNDLFFGRRLGLAVLKGDATKEGAAVRCQAAGAETRATVHRLPMKWPRE